MILYQLPLVYIFLRPVLAKRRRWRDKEREKNREREQSTSPSSFLPYTLFSYLSHCFYDISKHIYCIYYGFM